MVEASSLLVIVVAKHVENLSCPCPRICPRKICLNSEPIVLIKLITSPFLPQLVMEHVEEGEVLNCSADGATSDSNLVTSSSGSFSTPKQSNKVDEVVESSLPARSATPSPPKATAPRAFFCKACNVGPLYSNVTYQQHLAGKKHKRNTSRPSELTTGAEK